MTRHYDDPTLNEPFEGFLETMTVDQVRAFGPRVVVLPLGSVEPHGPHLPMGTDIFQVTALGRMATKLANQQGGKVLLYPTLPISNNANMTKLPFALRMGVDTLQQVIIDIARQVHRDGVSTLFVLNGHGGNPGALEAAMRRLSGMEDVPFACWAYGLTLPDYENPFEHFSDHGGENETSRMLYLRPDLVHQDKLENLPFGQLRIPELAKVNFVRPWHSYAPRTAVGETRKATAGKGQYFIEANAKGLANLWVKLSQVKMDDRFPYA